METSRAGTTYSAADQASSREPIWVPVEDGAEAFVELLVANGVEYLFLNPGTDTFPVQEALARRHALGRPVPQVVLCLHEHVALSAAHGHYMLSGRPQAIFIHVDQGTQNLGGALHNAQRGHAAILICAGRAPLTFEGEMRGSRSLNIHWWQEQRDQAGIVRNYVKWDYELRRNENIDHVVQRALQVAATGPCGPVYLALPREVLMEPMEQVRVLPVRRHGPAGAPQGDPQLLAEAARCLAGAQRPLVLTAMAGRNPAAVSALVRLAETLALPVVELRNRVNFPTDHPLHLGFNPSPYLEQADVVLVVDHDVPYIPTQTRPAAGATIIQLGLDPIQQDLALWGFPADLSITADSALALPALADRAEKEAQAVDSAGFRARYAALSDQHRAQRTRWREEAQARAGQRPMAAEWLAYCLGQALGENDIVVDEAVTNSPALARHVRSVQPGTYFKSGGSSLGWAMGAALGARLACPDRIVVAAVGDGAFVFSPPVAALWVADTHHAPFLTVIFNNACYNAPKASLRQAYPDGHSVRSGGFVGTDIVAPPDYALIAQACRAYGERVEDPDQVAPALARALEQVRAGRAAVLDVILAQP